jgi:hypothetical protein
MARISVKRRLKAWREVYWGPAMWVGNGLFLLYGIAVTVRDAFPPETQQTYQLNILLQRWSWRTWLIVFLSINLALALEGAYRAIKKRDAKIRELQPAGDLLLAEEDPAVYLDPLNAEFVSRGYMAFRISNQGQRVNPAQAVSIQRITNVPSIAFDYIDRIDPVDSKVILPTVDGDHLVPHHDILPELRQAWKDAHERGELDSDEFPFTIAIHYRDKKWRTFISEVSFKYSPIDEDAAHQTALSAHRMEYPILKVTGTQIRRLS